MSSMGFWVADNPMRTSGRSQSRSSLSSDSARCEPRLSRANACISSTITVRTWRSRSRLFSAVSSRYNDSGVVTRICGGLAQHFLPLGRRRVTRPNGRPNVRQFNAGLHSLLANTGQRQLQIAMNVVAQRLQR